MTSPSARRKEHFLQPGDVGAGDDGFMFRTLLGSCVSVTLWSPLRRVGAMSHFLLPSRGVRAPRHLDGRYADESLLLMFRKLRQLGADPRECQAKVFGGARMFGGEPQPDAMSIGFRNGSAARALLQAYRLPVQSEDLFGAGHRMVIFDVRNGDVWTRQVQPGDQERQAGR